jgi:hypothetical protein
MSRHSRFVLHGGGAAYRERIAADGVYSGDQEDAMKTRVIAVAMLGGVMLSSSAFAQDTTITRERTVTEPGPGVSVGVPGVGVHIGGPAQERRTTTETVGSDADCRSKTVHREDDAGSTTVRKERCD